MYISMSFPLKVLSTIFCWLVLGLPCFLPGRALSEEMPVPDLEFVNYAGEPVHAAAWEMPLSNFCIASDRDPDRPFRLVSASGEEVAMALFEGSEGPVLRVFISLPPLGRLAVKVEEADEWPESDRVVSAAFDKSAGEGKLNNGLIELHYAKGKWDLSFAAPKSTAVGRRQIVSQAHLDAWLDVESRGRLMGMKPAELGLVHADEAGLAGGEAKVHDDGSVELKLLKSFAPPFDKLTLTESLRLFSGLPVVSYRAFFTNMGDAPVHLAYVELGAGLRGSFGPLLRQEPFRKYEDARERLPILLSGPSNAYTRLAWLPEKSWMAVQSGSGVGLGFTTLRKITARLIGSSVWETSRSGFLICLFEPERGNLPYAISRENPLELGLAMQVTSGDVDAWRATGDLWKNLTAGKSPPAVPASYAVYLRGRPVTAGQVSSLFGAGTLVSDNGQATAALTIDFDQPYQIKADAPGASAENPVTLSVRALAQADASQRKVLELTGPGEQVVDLTQATGWLGQKESFVLEVAGLGSDVQAGLPRLAVVPAPPASPRLISPLEGAELTDFAVTYQWQGIKGIIDYELQLSRDQDFSESKSQMIRSEIEKPFVLPDEKDLPENGKWYWRVRALKDKVAGEWSEVRRMSVNNDHAKKPLQVEISPSRPLLTIEGFAVKDWSKFTRMLPEDIRPYAAFNTSNLKEDLMEQLGPLAAAGQKVLLRTHHPGPYTNFLPLAEVEALFRAYPEVIGIIGGESLTHSYGGGKSQEYTNRLLKLCGKYGRVFYEADGTYPVENKWEELYRRNGDLMREYADYLILAQKNNILHRQFVSQSSVLGLYLSGLIAQQGAWEDGGWYWQQVGFKGLGEIHGQRGGDVRNMPKNFWNLTFLMGLARGCAVFSLEGQTGVARVGEGYKLADKGFPPPNASPSAYMTTEGELTPVFERFILPLYRAIIREQLVPTKEEVLKQVRLAVYNDEVPRGSDPYYYEFHALYEGTYGFRPSGVIPGELMEFFPNTGRYYYFPILPQGAGELGGGIRTVPLSLLQSVPAVREIFDAAYPSWYTGDALVNMVGDIFTVLNTNENTDKTESYTVPLQDRGAFKKLSGRIHPHAYVVGKFKNGNRSVWLQANAEYPDRDTELVIGCATEPKVTVTPPEAAKATEWRQADETLTLRLSHQAGAVEVDIEP
jgi:hypothetical protein